MRQAQELLKLHFREYEIAGNAVKLLAKEKGRLTQVSEKEGQLQAGEILMRHKIGSEPYTAYALAEPRHMGKLKTGQQAILKVSGLPYVYYGTMQGEINVLSSSPDANGLYPLGIEVREQGKLQKRLTKGMQGTVNLITNEKPVLFFFFEKLAEGLSI